MVLSGVAAGLAAPPPLVVNRAWTWSPSQTRAMNVPLLAEVQLRSADEQQQGLALASEGVLRYVWHGRYGDMLIEVQGDDVFVNGQRVERHEG